MKIPYKYFARNWEVEFQKFQEFKNHPKKSITHKNLKNLIIQILFFTLKIKITFLSYTHNFYDQIFLKFVPFFRWSHKYKKVHPNCVAKHVTNLVLKTGFLLQIGCLNGDCIHIQSFYVNTMYKFCQTHSKNREHLYLL